MPKAVRALPASSIEVISSGVASNRLLGALILPSARCFRAHRRLTVLRLGLKGLERLIDDFGLEKMECLVTQDQVCVTG